MDVVSAPKDYKTGRKKNQSKRNTEKIRSSFATLKNQKSMPQK